MIEFTECENSGHMVGEGKKGQYWIEGMAWTYLKAVFVDKDGAYIEKLGAYDSFEDAKSAAEVIDNEKSD